MKKNPFTPLLFALVLFLLIRLTNDVPMRAHYLSHSWKFIGIELAGIITGCFLCDFLARKWLKYSMRRHSSAIVEYSAVILIPVGFCISIMGISHDVSLMRELPDLVIPVVITGLTSIWLYLDAKNQYLGKLYSESIIREQEARQARIEADLKLLRSQFHPHFLFNMLNTVYFTIDEENVRARDTVENLSNLLRSQLYEGNGTVLLEREISALNSYLELCRMRFGDSLRIDSKVDIEGNDEEIHPHLLLPLVENAVKHSGDSSRWIKVRLMREKDTVKLYVENSVTDCKAYPEEESGLGLSNLSKRLEILYPERFELTTEKYDDRFKASLKLDL